MSFSLDSNILIYTVDAGDPVRKAAATAIVQAAARRDCVLTVQSLGEFFRAVTSERLVSRTEAADRIRDWLTLFPSPLPSSAAALLAATTAAASGRFGFWDAMLLATAAAGGCQAMITEDMAGEAELSGVRIVAAFDKAGAIASGAAALLS